MASLKRSQLLEIINDDEKTSDEKANLILGEHQKVLTEIKEERDGYKEKAEKAAEVQEKAESEYKLKYEREHADFEDFKRKTAEDAEAARVKAAYRSLLVDEKIGAKRIETVMKAAEGLGKLKGLKLNDDGKFENEEELRKAIGDDWGEFRTTITEKGATVETPPKIGKATKTKEEILSIKDKAERLNAIAENHELFGF